jgi:hypothetical protein
VAYRNVRCDTLACGRSTSSVLGARAGKRSYAHAHAHVGPAERVRELLAPSFPSFLSLRCFVGARARGRLGILRIYAIYAEGRKSCGLKRELEEAAARLDGAAQDRRMRTKAANRVIAREAESQSTPGFHYACDDSCTVRLTGTRRTHASSWARDEGNGDGRGALEGRPRTTATHTRAAPHPTRPDTHTRTHTSRAWPKA